MKDLSGNNKKNFEIERRCLPFTNEIFGITIDIGSIPVGTSIFVHGVQNLTKKFAVNVSPKMAETGACHTLKRSSSEPVFPYATDKPIVPYPIAVTSVVPILRVGSFVVIVSWSCGRGGSDFYTQVVAFIYPHARFRSWRNLKGHRGRRIHDPS